MYILCRYFFMFGNFSLLLFLCLSPVSVILQLTPSGFPAAFRLGELLLRELGLWQIHFRAWKQLCLHFSHVLCLCLWTPVPVGLRAVVLCLCLSADIFLTKCCYNNTQTSWCTQHKSYYLTPLETSKLGSEYLSSFWSFCSFVTVTANYFVF